MASVLSERRAIPTAGNKLKEWSLNLVVLAVALGVVYGAAELYVSFFVDDGLQFDLEMWRYTRALKRVSANAAIGHEHRPNTHARLMGVDVDISSQGLRDREFAPTPPAGRSRLLMLGDSLTFGWGVAVENTYAKRLEGMLRRAGHDAEVINTGVGNWNTEMEVAYFLEHGAKFSPHYVVLNYFINDAEPTPKYQSSFLARHSRSFVYFASRVDATLRQAHIAQRTDWKAYYGSLYENGEGLRRVSGAIERLATYCREHGIKLFIANQPELRNPRQYPFAQVDRAIEAVAARNHVAYIPLLPAVRDIEPSKLWVTPPDPHPSAVAHDAFARALFRVFDAELRGEETPR